MDPPHILLADTESLVLLELGRLQPDVADDPRISLNIQTLFDTIQPAADRAQNIDNDTKLIIDIRGLSGGITLSVVIDGLSPRTVLGIFAGISIGTFGMMYGERIDMVDHAGADYPGTIFVGQLLQLVEEASRALSIFDSSLILHPPLLVLVLVAGT